MKRYVFFFLLLISVFRAPAQSTLLASVEIVEVRTEKELPVKKKKLKKKKRYKKPFKKPFKKPNKLKTNKIDYIKVGLLFNLIGTASLAVAAAVLAVIIGGWNAIIFIFAAGVCLLLSLIFLTIFLIYIAVKNKKIRYRKPDKKVILKKPEKDLRAEVSYLSEEKVKLYLTLNEELTTAKIRKNILIRNSREKSRKEWREAKEEIKELEAKINRAELRIKDLRTQNKIKKFRRERG